MQFLSSMLTEKQLACAIFASPFLTIAAIWIAVELADAISQAKSERAVVVAKWDDR